MKTETIRVTEDDIKTYLDIEKVPDELKDYVAVYEMREWSFGERERIIGNSSNQSVSDDGKIKSVLNSAIFRLAVMQTCVRRVSSLNASPTKAFLEAMPVWLGEALWEKVNALNEKGMTKEESKKFKFS